MNSISFLSILLLVTIFGRSVTGERGQAILISTSNEELVVSSKQCRSGAFFPSPTTFNCACITGVWGFYSKFCDKLDIVIGGDRYCFRADNNKVAQIALVGSSRYPFAPSISHFYDKYIQLTSSFTEEEQITVLDASGSWITITDTVWTIFSDGDEAVCLTPTRSGRRIYCLFGTGLDAALDDKKWNTVTRVQQGCHSSKSVKADKCFKIHPPNDRSNCAELPTDSFMADCDTAENGTKPLKSECEESQRVENPVSKGDGWLPLYPPLKSPKSGTSTELPKSETSTTELSKTDLISNKLIPKMALSSTKITKPKAPIFNITGKVDMPNIKIESEENWINMPKNTSPKPTTTTGSTTTENSAKENVTSEENWIPVSRTHVKNETKNITCEVITRESVKKYWLDPANNECAKSINEAVFTDQLRRYTVTRLDKVFDSRLHSLEQMGQLLSYSRDIMKKVCGTLYVPLEFFDVAADAFTMFMREDFFYQGEEVESVPFDRILKSLGKCLKRTKSYVFETNPLGCELKKITGTLILPGEKVNVTIPTNGKSKHFEPLIETVWKMFTNAHAYCFEDFQFVNDHHRFSVQFLGLFSRTIYEKWIEPLRHKELYKFIIPQFQVLSEIMENLDYCVAATNQICKFSTWLTRSSPLAKSLTAVTDTRGRRKRSIWANHIDHARERTKFWNGKAHCVQSMEEPSFSLGYFKDCNQVF